MEIKIDGSIANLGSQNLSAKLDSIKLFNQMKVDESGLVLLARKKIPEPRSSIFVFCNTITDKLTNELSNEMINKLTNDFNNELTNKLLIKH